MDGRAPPCGLLHSRRVSRRSHVITRSDRISDGSTVFQLSYTSLFGFHCAYLFLRTGSLLPPTVSHIFCNVMGLPQYGLHVRSFPKRRLGKLDPIIPPSISAHGETFMDSRCATQSSSSRTF